MDTKKYLINREFSQRTYQSAKNYADQQRLPTEKAKDDATGETPESEFAQPYGEFSVSYGEMEYYMQSPSGQAGARTESVWDTPWVAPQQTSDSFKTYWADQQGIPTPSNYSWISEIFDNTHWVRFAIFGNTWGEWDGSGWLSHETYGDGRQFVWLILLPQGIGHWKEDFKPIGYRFTHNHPNPSSMKVSWRFYYDGVTNIVNNYTSLLAKSLNFSPPAHISMFQTETTGAAAAYRITNIEFLVPNAYEVPYP